MTDRMTWRLPVYLFLGLSLADLISTIVGLDMGLLEGGFSARTVESMDPLRYGIFRMAGAGVTILLFRGLGLLFERLAGVDLPIRILFYVLTIVLAGVVLNNVAKILIFVG